MRGATLRILILAKLALRLSGQVCHYAASRSLLRVKQECQRLGMSMYFWWDEAAEKLEGQLCVIQCPDGLVSHQKQCVLPEPPGFQRTARESGPDIIPLPARGESMQLLLRASLCGTEEERWLAMTEARLRIGILFQIPMSEVRMDVVKCPPGAGGVRNLGDLQVTCKAEVGEPGARFWQVVAAWTQPGFVAVSELRFFADAACATPLPQPKPPSDAVEALAGSSRGSLASVKAYDGDPSTAFAHRCYGADCLVRPGEAYLQVEYAVPQTVRCVQIEWQAPKLSVADLQPLWVLRRKGSLSEAWIDSGIWRGANAPDDCHGVECGAFGVCQPAGNDTNVTSCQCFEGFRGAECDNHTKKASVSPEIFDNVPDTSIPNGHFEQHYYVRRPEDCGDMCLGDYNCESWAYSPWSEICRTGTWSRSSSCRQPLGDQGWGYFEKHRGEIRIPYYPTSDSTCGVDVPDDVLASGPHILSVRIVSTRLGMDAAALKAAVANLGDKLEALLGFPSILLTTGVAVASEKPSDLLPVGRVVALWSSSQGGYFGLDRTGTWSFHVDGNASSTRHQIEILDAGDGNVALRSLASPFHFLEAATSGDSVVCRGAAALPSSSWYGFRFRAKEVASSFGSTHLLLISADFGVALNATADGSCSWQELKESSSNISEEMMLVVQDVSNPATSAAPSSSIQHPVAVVDQDGREISSPAGVEVTTDWFSVLTGTGSSSPWLEIPLSWEGVALPPVMGQLMFGIWEKPLWLGPEGPTDGGRSDGGGMGENPGDDGVDPESWQDWFNWQSGNPIPGGRNRTQQVIEVLWEGPFHPLPTWLGWLLSALLGVMIIASAVYAYRTNCRSSKITPAPSNQQMRWSPSGQEKSGWAPRAGGNELAEVQPESPLPDAKSETSFKARAAAADADTPKAAPVASWITGGDLARSEAEDQLSKTWQGPFLHREGSQTGPMEEPQSNSKILERASSLRYTGARTAAALTDSASPPTTDEAQLILHSEAKAEEREARHERVKMIARSIREDMKADRSAGMPKEQRLQRLQDWQRLWDPSEGDKVAIAVTNFLEEATNWYLKGAPTGEALPLPSP